MNKRYINLMAAVGIAVSFSACNDYESAAIGYDEVEEEPIEVVTPPTVDGAWQLKAVANNGQFNNNIFVYKDQLYNALFTRNLGWNGGDIVYSYRLPDGHLVWGVKDSYFGVVDPETRIRRADNKTIRTSMLLQSGDVLNPAAADLFVLNTYVQTDDPEADNYYIANELCPSDKTTRRYIPTLANWCNNQLHVLYGYCSTTTAATRYSTTIVDYSLNGNPGDAGYLVQDNINNALNTVSITFDQSQYEDEDGYTYMYSATQMSGINGVLVARCANHDFTSPWEYWVINNDGQWVWTTEVPSTTGNGYVLRSNVLVENGSCQFPQVLKKGDWYYLVGQKYSNGNDVYIWRSKNPQGPFSDRKTLFVVPSMVDKQGYQYYSTLSRVVLHKDLSRTGELVFSTTQQTSSSQDNFTYPGSADYLRPYFYRVFDWEKLYNE